MGTHPGSRLRGLAESCSSDPACKLPSELDWTHFYAQVALTYPTQRTGVIWISLVSDRRVPNNEYCQSRMNQHGRLSCLCSLPSPSLLLFLASMKHQVYIKPKCFVSYRIESAYTLTEWMCLSLITGYQSARGSLGLILWEPHWLVSHGWVRQNKQERQQKYIDVCNFAHFCRYSKCIKSSEGKKGEKKTSLST